MIHPAIETFVRAARERSASDGAATVQQRRDSYRAELAALQGEQEPMASVDDVIVALQGRNVPARLYVPLLDEGQALVIFFHGGSFVAGDLDTHDALCRRLSADSRMRFLSIDYRLAPEFPFPAGIDDAVDVIRFVAGHVGDYDAPSAKIIVMGESAGATIATVACSITRGDHLGLAGQVLIYPTLGPELLTDSAHSFGQGYMLDLDRLRQDYADYLGKWTDHTDPRVSPLMSVDLTGVPAAIVVVAECDALRDEGVAYAGLLEHFGIPVEILEAKGMVHGFLRLGPLVPEALDIVDDLARHMHRYVENATS
ncbi:MAG TPA: alpha/beta hydrolase [Acidimicrobiales bacterium]|nr:alpha/beta hydrolase [Acidimicrobiales bacterium]